MTAPPSDDSFKQALDAELRRRLDALREGVCDDAVGRFDARDWVVIAVLFVAVPLLAAWWFA